MPLETGTRLGPYEIVGPIGSGGMGDVFRARDTRLNRAVAVKVLAPHLQSDHGFTVRFSQEAQAVAALSHPNIVTIHDVGEDADRHFMVMELLEGETLRDRLCSGALAFAEVRDIGIQVATALHAAHSAGVLHRDVKPANIFVTTSGVAKLMDFGIAKRMATLGTETAAALTGTGQLVGTLNYMSPEQARGLSVDERTDVFSLAAVLYELATGHAAFDGATALDTLLAITSATPRSMQELRPTLPPEFVGLIGRGLARDAGMRISSAAAFAEALRSLTVEERYAVTLPQFRPRVANVNLPVAVTRTIGREPDIAAASELLLEAATRLVNCTGPAGVGKTRLAIEVARHTAPAFPDGVLFVPLEMIRESADVQFQLTKMLQLRDDSGCTAQRALIAFLRDRAMLIVLDNFEHVVAAGSLLTDLLAECPRLKFLVTSRAALNVRAEQQFAVQTLAPGGAGRGSQSPDVELFVERARAINPQFHTDEQTMATIAEICARLDGLPLAIELAAARTRVLAPSQLLARLDNRLQLLGSTIRDLPERQRTLRGAIDWSYELLSPADRELLMRLAAFAGGATLAAVEAVVETDVLDSLTALVDNQLLTRTDRLGAEPRVAMLEMVRDYGLEKLAASGMAAATYLRHAEYYLRLAEDADRQLCTADHNAALDRLESDYANCRSACDRFVAAGRHADVLRMTLALWRFWEMRGYWSEGRLQLQRVLAQTPASAPLSLRAGAIYAAGVLADAQSDFAAARLLFEQHLTLQRGMADPRAIAAAMNNLGVVAMRQGDYAAAEAYHAETLATVRAAGLQASEAASLNNLGHVALRRADPAAARDKYQESLRISRRLGDRRATAWTLSNLADVSWEAGDYRDAHELYGQSLNLFRELDDKPGQASCMADLGNVACQAGDLDLAATLYQESLVLFADLGDKRGITRVVEGFASVAAARGMTAVTLRLAAVAGGLRTSLGVPTSASRTRNFRAIVEAARASAGAAANRWWSEGAAMSVSDALQYALESAVS